MKKVLRSWAGIWLLFFCAFAAAPTFAADNTLYGIELSTNGTQHFYTVDQTTGAATQVAGVSPTFTSAAMARNPTTGIIFYTEYTTGGATASGRVATWNPTGNAKATLGTTPATQFIRLAFDSAGTLYGMNQNNQLYTLNTTSGAATLLGTVTGTGLVANGGGDIAFSPTGTLYMTVGSTLYTVNIATRTANSIGSTGVGAPPTGLAFGIDGNLYSTVLDADDSDIYKINPATGASTLMPSSTGAPIGDLASMPKYADLQITKTANGTFTAGQTASYTLSVKNNGPQIPSAPITVTDTLPIGLAYFSATGTNWTCSQTTGTVTCTSSTIPAVGATMAAITLTVTVASAPPATISNTAKVSTTTFDQTAANNSSTVITSVITSLSISGTIFEDAAYAGGAGSSLATSGGIGRGNVRVELYNSVGLFVSAVNTLASGTYSFPVVVPGNYTVRVVNSTVTSARGGVSLIGVQTFRTSAALADTNRVGGEDPTKADAAAGAIATTLASLTTTAATPQSIGSVTATLTNAANVDFGFNFDTIVNTKDAGQGSLRQFIINANALPGADSSIFMISDGAAHAGLRAGLTNQLTGGVAVITLASLLPALSDADTTIDGTEQTANIGNTNSGALGAGGTVGVDLLTLSTVQRPEVQLADGATTLTIGLDLQGINETVRGLTIYGFGTTANDDASANIRLGASAANALIEQNILGSNATSFADPGAGARSIGDNVRSTGADNGILRNNLIGFSTGKGFGVENGSTGWTIENNEIRGNGIGNSNLDGIDLESAGTTGNTVRGNLSTDNEGVGVDSYQSNGSNTIVNNTITNNGIGTGANVETTGVRLFGANNTVDRNIIFANYGAGVMITSAASANTVTRNSIYANGTVLTKTGGAASGQIGIDLQNAADNLTTGTAAFVTVNDSSDADAGGNGLQNFPVLESARILGGNLVVNGFARPGATVEFFIAAPDASGFGEGQTYLFTFTEGAVQDTDATSGTYTSPFGGKTVGTDTTNRFSFSSPLPSGVSLGTTLTATATLSAATSEFSNTISVASAPPAVALVKSVTPTGTQLPGSEITYTITFTNSGGQAATNFRLTDPDPANTTLKLNTNTDYKIGSVSSTLGTTGLTATISFSNDNGVSYTYTPVSLGGGAPAGFDRNVTHIRWTFSGTLSQTAPNNTGSISFVVRIR